RMPSARSLTAHCSRSAAGNPRRSPLRIIVGPRGGLASFAERALGAPGRGVVHYGLRARKLATSYSISLAMGDSRQREALPLAGRPLGRLAGRRLPALTLRRYGAPASLVLEDLAALHHEADLLHDVDVGQRIAGDGDDVGLLAGLERAGGLGDP